MSTVPASPTRRALLDTVRAHEKARRDAEVATLVAALEWAIAHEALTLEDAAFHLECGFGEHGLSLAGVGAPLVLESAVAELAVALRVSTGAGRSYLGDALEIRYRLPRLWEAVLSGRCAWWRARRVAQRTTILCHDGAEHVDRHLAGFVSGCSFAQLDRLIETALVRFDPEQAEARRKAGAEQRHVTIKLDGAGPDQGAGTVWVEAVLDAADALDLETALADRARELGLLGCTETLAVRRSVALGDLARHHQTLTLDTDHSVRSDGVSVRLPARRRVVLHVHLTDAAVTGHATGHEDTARAFEAAEDGVARVANLRTPVTAAQARTWCGSAAQITIRPILDLAAQHHTEAYEASAVLAEQTRQRDLHCVFPHCTRPATGCDLEHPIPWPTGPTDSGNQALLCRRHHRHKTHHGWSYVVVTPGTYLWSSPNGLASLRTPAGTFDLTPPAPAPAPSPRPTTRHLIGPPRPPSRLRPPHRPRPTPAPAAISDGAPPPF